MSDQAIVQTDRRPAALPPLLAAVLAWALPGLGHLLLGRKARGVLFFLLVLAALTIGYSLDGNLPRSALGGQPLAMLATFGCMGLGLPYFVLAFLLDYQGNLQAAGYEYGSAFILSAGLMNLLLVLDAWDIASGTKS